MRANWRGVLAVASFALLIGFYGWQQWIISVQPKREANPQHTSNRSGETVSPESAEERTADYTEALARYTGALVAVTTLLAIVSCVQIWFLIRADKAAKAAAELSSKEFVSTHRPRLRVRFFETFDQPLIAVRFALTNEGESPAIVIAIAASILQGMDAPRGVIFLEEEVNIGLESGESDTHRVESNWPQLNHGNRGYIGLPPTFCVGRIRYRDLAGIVRETGFCRQYESIHDIWYIPDQVPEYEYAY